MGQFTCTSHQTVGEQPSGCKKIQPGRAEEAGGASPRVFFPCDLEKACPFIQVGVMKQSFASNISFPFLIRRKLGPRQADFKLCIVKLQRREPEATQTLQFRAPSCV